MYVCVFACVYVYMYLCMYVFTHVCMYSFIPDIYIAPLQEKCLKKLAETSYRSPDKCWNPLQNALGDRKPVQDITHVCMYASNSIYCIT